jgi:hypothetical protein
MYGEYVWEYITAVRRAPLNLADRIECYGCLAEWIASRTHLKRTLQAQQPIRPAKTALASPLLEPGDCLIDS